MTRKEKKAYISEIKALKKKEKQNENLTLEEIHKLTDYYNKTATRNSIIAGVITSISLLMVIAWIVVKWVLLAV